MQCKSCKRDLPENALFCCWCGEKQIRERRKKDEITVPKPVKRGNRYTIQLRAENWSTTEDSAEECIIKAKAVRAGFIEAKKHPENITLTKAIDRDISNRDAALSPSTIAGYRVIQRNRFPELMNMPVGAITQQAAQKAVNAESKKVLPNNKTLSSKTIANSWMYVNKIIEDVTGKRLDVTTAAVVSKERVWLEPKEILTFCKLIRGKDYEIGALLALSSLRKSEILALRWENVDLAKQKIYVRGATLCVAGQLVDRQQNKSSSSRRDVPIMIDRLYELLQSAEDKTGYVYRPKDTNRLQKQIKAVCIENGLPPCGIHSLRHSFASFCASRSIPFTAVKAIGGWSNPQTVLKIYTHTVNSDITLAADTFKEYTNTTNLLQI